MIFYHHDLKVELDDAEWAETQIGGFVPPGAAYRVDLGHGAIHLKIRAVPLKLARRHR
jgi:hypothetical protein